MLETGGRFTSLDLSTDDSQQVHQTDAFSWAASAKSSILSTAASPIARALAAISCHGTDLAASFIDTPMDLAFSAISSHGISCKVNCTDRISLTCCENFP